MAYSANDEFPLEALPEVPLWSENFAAFFTDVSSKVAIMYSSGRWHGDPNLWREFLFVGLPDNRILYHRGYGRGANNRGPGSGLTRYEILEPLRSVRLSFDGPISESTASALIDRGPLNEPASKRMIIDVCFDTAAPVWDMKGDSHEAVTMIGGIHIDHIGTANGRIDYDGKSHTLKDGFAVRDHSRGVRDMRHYGGHAWINGRFPGGRSFHVYAARVQGSDSIGMSNAVVVQGDSLYPAKLRHVDMLTSIDDCAARHRVVLDSELGEMDIEITETIHSFPYSMLTPFDTTVGRVRHRNCAAMFDEFVRLRYAGMDGVGWSERGLAPQPI